MTNQAHSRLLPAIIDTGLKIQISVIPAQAGIQKLLIYHCFQMLDSRLRGNDEF